MDAPQDTTVEPWVILLRRYGTETRSPSTGDLAKAVSELFDESIPAMTESDYREHGAASLRYGFDAGPMFTVEITRSGSATLEQWADQD
jgi:hypothetical protein